jgi:hypothetical protein
MRRIFLLTLMICAVYLYSQSKSGDWLSEFDDQIAEQEVDSHSRILSYENLIGTYWVIADPFINSKKYGDSDVVVITTDGYIFLPDNVVLIVDTVWEAFYISKYTPNAENILSSSIGSINKLARYVIEDGKILIKLKSNYREGCLANNSLYLKDVYSTDNQQVYEKFHLVQTFPITTPDGEYIENLWLGYVR